jgi:hypothetical protein
MPSQHKHSPLRLRLPEAERAWVLAQHEETGRPVNAIIAEAVAAARKAAEGGTTAQVLRGIKVVTDDRVPPGIVALAGPDHDGKPQVVAARVAPGPDCKHPRARVHKGLCGACGTYVGNSTKEA